MSNRESAAQNLPAAKWQGLKAGTGKLSNTVRPFVSVVAALAISGMLVVTILLTRLSVQWVTFLSGVLLAALLAEATRVSRAEWKLLRRNVQLSSLKDKLDRETLLRKASDQKVAAGKSRLQLIDEELPTMLLFVDVEGRCRYHNRSFRDWLHFRPEQIDGLHMNEVVGARVYQEISSFIRQSLDGHKVQYQRCHKMPDGAVCKLSVTHLPQYAPGGKVTGFYMLADDVTEIHKVTPAAHAGEWEDNQELHLASDHVAVQNDAGAEIMAAIEKNEFRLFCQQIAPLAGNVGRAEYYEILVRLMEEEEGMIPPGAFFPLAEKLGMMPRLDRWVVKHVVERIATQIQQNVWPEGSVYFINVSEASVNDPGFADYLEVTLLEYGIPGATLCFEIPSTQLSLLGNEVATFAKRISECGAHISLSGFGGAPVEFEGIRDIRVDYLKIDGGTLLGILDDPVALAKVTALKQVARKMGAKTIAEMVESEEVVAKLSHIGVDFAQGFGISRPRPLSDRTGGVHVTTSRADELLSHLACA